MDIIEIGKINFENLIDFISNYFSFSYGGLIPLVCLFEFFSFVFLIIFSLLSISQQVKVL
jgi:hypothetical protein